MENILILFSLKNPDIGEHKTKFIQTENRRDVNQSYLFFILISQPLLVVIVSIIPISDSSLQFRQRCYAK